MELVTGAFLKLLSMALTALPVMAMVLAARLFLRRAPKKYAYGLWAAVGVRLTCPVGLLRTAWSIFNLRPLERMSKYAANVETGFAAQPLPALRPAFAAPAAGAPAVPAVSAAGSAPPARELFLRAGALFWLAGVLALLLWGAVSYLRLQRRVSAAVPQGGGVWVCQGLPTPFLLGFFRPRILIPTGLEDSERLYVLAHERHHLRRRDQWWKLLSCLLLAVYWWNPAAWVCWVLFCRDLEMSCDEAVLRQLGDQVKKGYSRSLVSFALERQVPAVLAFGEHDAVRRVRNVLNWKRETPRAAFLAAAAVVLTAAVCMTNASDKSWVRAANVGDGAALTWMLREPVRSWAVYEDVYENGTLLSSTARVLDGFAEDGTGVSPRRLTAALRADVARAAGSGFGGELHCGFDAGAFTWTTRLPKARYTAAGSVAGPGTDAGSAPRRVFLEGTDETVLYSVLFSARPDGVLTGYDRERGLAGANDTVVQFRLVTSTDAAVGADAAHRPDLAETLFALRTEALETKTAAALLEALSVPEVGTYAAFVEASGGQKGAKILRVEFAREPEDIDPTSPRVDGAMYPAAELLLALAQELEEVQWSYPSREDGYQVLLTVYCGRETADAHARALGYADSRELGRSARGVRDLLSYLGLDGSACRVSASGGEISAAWYPDGQFDFAYDGLPVLVLEETNQLALDPGSGGDTLTAGVDYYRPNGTVERRTQELSRQEDGQFWLHLDRQDPLAEESAVCFIPWEDGKFVFRVQQSVVRHPFTGLLGYNGFWVDHDFMAGVWCIRTYYAQKDGEAPFPIAESFGGDGGKSWTADLDGDGREELICCCVFGGDGHQSVCVYQRRGDGVYRGYLELAGRLPDHEDWGANSTWEEYDPERQVFRIHYAVKDGGDYAVAETSGLDWVVFEAYEPS
ncbi:M56 family metallopeptidase [Dysosmobacter sp.]